MHSQLRTTNGMITIGLVRNPLDEHRRYDTIANVMTENLPPPASSRTPKHNDTSVPQLHSKVVVTTSIATDWWRLHLVEPSGSNAEVSALGLMRHPLGSHRRGWDFELESCEGAPNLGPPFTVGVGEAGTEWLCGMRGGAFARTRGGIALGCPGSRP